MARLAIKGHATRGREVIELLEMLGGKNVGNYTGQDDAWYYFIRDNEIDWYYNLNLKKNTIFFTLEEFLEKFPYKVGDKVIYHGSKAYIKSMRWDGIEIVYKVECNKELWDTTMFYLQPYKEETMEGKRIPPYMDYDVKAEETMEGKLISKEEMSLKIDTSQMEKRQIIFHTDAPDKTELVLGDNFEIKVEDGKTYVVKKKPQYPKTYEECCNVLSCKADDFFTDFSYNGYDVEVSDYEDKIDDLLQNFRKLIYCRDVYWKIAGEEMGLGKSWEYDMSKDEFSYAISYQYGHIQKNEIRHRNAIFVFPTAKMRDAFKENFDKDLEICKELL